MKIVLVAALVLSACVSPKSGTVVPYPLDLCAVTGNRLGSMGNIITKIYGDREIKFCCRPCVKEFEADPDTFLEELDALAAK